MQKNLPPLTWFRSFEAAARSLSTTAAAAEIGLTQSAVSQQIRALETRLGVALFARHARGLTLTDEGRKLLPQVEAALLTLQAATEPFALKRGPEQLSIAASVSVIEWVIAPALPAFRAAHPDLSIRFLSTIWPDEYVSARADVEIRFGSARQVGIGAVPLEPATLVAVKSPGLIGDLADLPLIETVGVLEGWRAWGKAAGISGLRPTSFVDSYGLALRLAAHDGGVALVSSLIAAGSLASGALAAAHDVVIEGKERYFLSVRATSAPAKAFAAWFGDLVA